MGAPYKSVYGTKFDCSNLWLFRRVAFAYYHKQNCAHKLDNNTDRSTKIRIRNESYHIFIAEGSRVITTMYVSFDESISLQRKVITISLCTVCGWWWREKRWQRTTWQRPQSINRCRTNPYIEWKWSGGQQSSVCKGVRHGSWWQHIQDVSQWWISAGYKTTPSTQKKMCPTVHDLLSFSKPWRQRATWKEAMLSSTCTVRI